MSVYPRGQGLQIEAARAASSVGPAFVALLLEDERSRADAVSALLSQLAGPETRVVRVDAQLRSLLTLDRPTDRAADAVARVLAERQGREAQVVLLIEQAEALPYGTLLSLQAMAPYFVRAGRPALRVAFVGRPTFRALVAAEELAPLRQALGFDAELAGGASDLAATGAATARARLARARRRALQIYLLAALALLAGMAALVYWGLEAPSKPNIPALAATPAVPSQAASVPPALVPLLEQPPPTSPPPAETGQPASLHRDFDSFLAGSGRSAASLTQAQRDALVSEFLRRRAPPGHACRRAGSVRRGPCAGRASGGHVVHATARGAQDTGRPA